MSERFHPNMRDTRDRVIVTRDMFVFTTGDPDALYQHLEDVLTDVVVGDTDIACERLRLLMHACTKAAERAS